MIGTGTISIRVNGQLMSLKPLTPANIRAQYERALEIERAGSAAGATKWREFWEELYLMTLRPTYVTIRLDGAE